MPQEVHSDRRDINPHLGELSGEASGQIALRREEPSGVGRAALIPWNAADPTYYGRPLLKESVWGIDIPLYYFVGGAAGAALALGAAVQLACEAHESRDLRRFSATCHWIGIIGSTLGAALLIHDLGKPLRFLHMMRVFRPSSPMNMGVWILAGSAPTAIATGLFLNRGGLLGRIGEITGYTSGVFGAGLACYTGVLVANTALPLWQDARGWLPILFAASSASAAASVIELFYEGPSATRITQIFGTVGRFAELAAARQVEAACCVVPRVGEPLRSGASGRLWKLSGALTAASMVLSLIPGRRGWTQRLAGGLGAAGSLCLRFAVHYAGQASARDARASFQHQRAGHGGAEVSGAQPRPIKQNGARHEGEQGVQLPATGEIA
jgi:formate-dependent nitrite reductase membrane component NrfD